MKKELKQYIILWGTQSLSALGSGMTSYALVLWLYLNSGSALKTAMLSVCSYAPYVIMSIFAGALSDKWNKKKTMLICDLIAAMSTLCVFFLIRADMLVPVHLYIINAVNSLMNTVQQPASEVASTLLIPKEYYQKTSGMRSFSRSLNSVLTPVASTAIFSAAGIGAVIAVDIATFLLAFFSLLIFIHIPETESKNESTSLKDSAKEGLVWLKKNPLILKLILFLACINLVASTYEAALPAMVLSKANKTALSIVSACVGLASVAGSLIVTFLPAPKNRVRAICAALMLSMSTENFLLAFGDNVVIWSIGAVFGWLLIPYMSANLDVIFRTDIPPEMQGRVYSCRNTLQFFTIPIGYLLGGIMVDKLFEPLMNDIGSGSILRILFGNAKGSGAAMMFAFLGVIGTLVCIVFTLMLRKYKWSETDK